ncbi:MAG: DUF4381 domain-containing protein [Parahaliea sp.]
MQANDPLAQLKPLRLPADPPWWPPAPGWWLLALLCLLLLAGVTWLWWRRHRARRYRRQAITALDRLQASWPADNPAGFGARCNRLLKGVALRSFPAQQVAALSGAPWRDFLNRTAGQATPLFDTDFKALYQPPSASAPERETLYRASRRWIQHHEAAP